MPEPNHSDEFQLTPALLLFLKYGCTIFLSNIISRINGFFGAVVKHVAVFGKDRDCLDPIVQIITVPVKQFLYLPFIPVVLKLRFRTLVGV